MSRREFRSWWEFHKRNPIDPIGLHLKPAALIAAYASGSSKVSVQKLLDTLVPKPDDDEAQDWFDRLG